MDDCARENNCCSGKNGNNRADQADCEKRDYEEPPEQFHAER